MIRQTYPIEIITPCFSGGALPFDDAEIRSASLRGQFCWWFRVLGGFKSLPMIAKKYESVREQENHIFGATAGDSANAGLLQIRVVEASGNTVKLANADDLTNRNRDDPKGYLLFPLRRQDDWDGKKAVLYNGSFGNVIHGAFVLHLLWRGEAALADDLRALVTVIGSLGSLGFRARRAMGALRLPYAPMLLDEAMDRFINRAAVSVFEWSASGEDDTIKKLAHWLRSWRHHGQRLRKWDWVNYKNQSLGKKWYPITTPPPKGPGFSYARRDHNEGLDVQGTGAPSPDPDAPAGESGTTFRPALGLPIIQYFSSLADHRGGQLKRSQSTVNWTASDGGRFASPVILRPHFDGTNWRALVIFVDAMSWRASWQVILQTKRWNPRRRQEEDYSESRDVSLALYDEMKKSCLSGGPWKLFV